MILLQAYGTQGMECGSLNVTGPQKLIGVTLLDFIGGGVTLLKCGLVGESMSLWGQTLRSLLLKLPSM